MRVSDSNNAGTWRRGGVIRRDFRATHDDVVLPEKDFAAYRVPFEERLDKFYPVSKKKRLKKSRPCRHKPHQWSEWQEELFGGRSIGTRRTCEVCKKTEANYKWSRQ